MIGDIPSVTGNRSVLPVKGSSNPYRNKSDSEIIQIIQKQILDILSDIEDIKSTIPNYKQHDRSRRDLYDGFLILRDTESRMYKIYDPNGEHVDKLTDSYYMSEMLARSAIDLFNKRQRILEDSEEERVSRDT